MQARRRVDGGAGRHANRRRRGVQAEVVAAHQHRQRDDGLEQGELVTCRKACRALSEGFQVRMPRQCKALRSYGGIGHRPEGCK